MSLQDATIGRMSQMRIQVGSDVTEVAVRLNVLHDVGPLLRGLIPSPSAQTAVLITDKDVGRIYAPALLASLTGSEFKTLEFRIEAGEQSKSLAVAREIYQFLASNTVPRDATIITLGGGVVSDLGGFVAATWMRGVRFVICPTTMEADIDASIGGKTAINLQGGKNLVGAFHQPILVAIDPACLNTLGIRDVRAGLAESIKHALIRSGEFLTWQETNVDPILALDGAHIIELILRNLAIKAKIVEQDVQEQTGVRVMLNFGHTIGHAIEACCGFDLRHGECVALGMVAACRLSHTMGLLDESVVKRVETVLTRFGLPTQLSRRIDTDSIMAVMRNDKKRCGGIQRFVLLEGVAKPAVREDVSEQQARDAYESLLP